MNMMRTSLQNSKISAYEGTEGAFDFNKTPLSILGTIDLAFLDPEDQASWQTHAVDVFYIADCPLHYPNMWFYESSSRSFRITATLPTVPEADQTIVTAN